MEINNETKLYVATQYYGQPFLVCYNIENKPVIEKFEFSSGALEFYDPDPVNKRNLLILKPLSALSEMDVLGVYKILTTDERHAKLKLEFYGKESIIETLLESRSTNNWTFNTSNYIYQFLQSKGYDLPNVHLDGKTLKEAGLAVYE